MKRFVLGVGLLACFAPRAWAAWPYVTEQARTVSEGACVFALGVSRTWQDSPELPGGRGALWQLPEMEVRLGVGPHAEVAADYEMLWLEPYGDRKETYESGDLRLWTKLGLFPGRVRGLALRFGVKLPNAANERGLGTDETDVFVAGLYDFVVGPFTGSANGGIGILGDPEHNAAQNDVFTWAGSLRTDLSGGFGLGGEASGWLNRHHQFATLSAVGDWTWRKIRVSLAGRRGIQEALGWGGTLGLTYQW